MLATLVVSVIPAAGRIFAAKSFLNTGLELSILNKAAFKPVSPLIPVCCFTAVKLLVITVPSVIVAVT